MKKRHGALRRQLAAFVPLKPRFDARNVLSRSAQTLRGRICSKVGQDLRIESKLQATFCLRAGAHSRVVWFTTEPFTIREVLRPYQTRYTPDAAVRYSDGTWDLVETKYTSQLAEPGVWMRLLRIREQMAVYGFSFRVATDRELFNEGENERIRRVKAHAKCFHERRTHLLNARLQKSLPMTVAQAEEFVCSRSVVYHLIAQRRVYIDFTQSITASTLLHWDPKEIKNEIQLFSSW